MNKTVARFILTVSCFLFFCCTASAKSKKPSGIYGYALFNDNQPTEEGPHSYFIPNCEIVIKDEHSNKIIKRAYSDASGKFKITLPPGKYIIFPVHKDYTDSWITDKTKVTVWQGFYFKADASFNNGW